MSKRPVGICYPVISLNCSFGRGSGTAGSEPSPPFPVLPEVGELLVGELVERELVECELLERKFLECELVVRQLMVRQLVVSPQLG